MPGSIAGNVVARIGETILIQVREVRTGCLAVTQTGPELGTDHIRPRVAIAQAPDAVLDGERLPGLQGDNPAERPAPDDAVRYPIHAAPNPTIPPDGKVENDGCSQAVWSIVGADPVLGLQIVQQLRIIVLEVANPGVPSCSGIIRRLGEGVVAFKADVVASALLEANLQRMVPGVGSQRRQPFEAAVKLRVGQQ